MSPPPEAPRTYAEWSRCLDRLTAGTEDEACLEAMGRGELSWTGGVGPLFAERLADEFNRRLARFSAHLTRDLRQGADDATVVRAIINARQSLFFLHRLAGLAVFAETLRTHLADELRRFAERAQQSLEDSAQADRSGRLRLLLRNNSLLRYDVLSAPAAAPTPDSFGAVASPAAASLANSGARRRNILT